MKDIPFATKLYGNNKKFTSMNKSDILIYVDRAITILRFLITIIFYRVDKKFKDQIYIFNLSNKMEG
jgi:hypothetical protein